MNPQPLPLTSAYIAGLPAGLDSYPDCLAHRSILEGLVRDHGHVGRAAGLPGPVRRLLTLPVKDDWIPEVVFQAANLAIRDHAFEDDAGFMTWTTDWSRELLDKPVLKHLMRLLSPTLVVSGAAKRWKAVHVGSRLEARLLDDEAGRARSVARLTFPPHLFPELFLRGLVGVFDAAVRGARGRDTRVRLLSHSDSHAEYETSWVA